MTIAAILHSKGHDVVTVGPDVTLQQVADILAEHRIGCVPVISMGAVVGIISERDIVHAVSDRGAPALDRPAHELMTSPPVVVTADMGVMAALSLMTLRRLRHLPVIECGALAGFISIGDLVKYRIDRIEAEASAMREYIQSV